ncbi:MAG: response regulator transcription factor [Flavobacteriales bacterium]
MVVRTLLADSGELALMGFRAVFAKVPRVELLGEVLDAESMYTSIEQDRPHVVLIDHTAQGFGADSIREGMRRCKHTRFVAITPDPSPITLMNALRAGVTSYIKKDCGIDEIVDAVLSTADGGKFFCGEIVKTMGREGVLVETITEDSLNCGPIMLSEREVEIILLIAEGQSYTRIADRLNLSPNTVNTHRRNIMGKVGVNSTAALVMYAVKQGIVSPNKFLFNTQG